MDWLVTAANAEGATAVIDLGSAKVIQAARIFSASDAPLVHVLPARRHADPQTRRFLLASQTRTSTRPLAEILPTAT